MTTNSITNMVEKIEREELEVQPLDLKFTLAVFESIEDKNVPTDKLPSCGSPEICELVNELLENG